VAAVAQPAQAPASACAWVRDAPLEGAEELQSEEPRWERREEAQSAVGKALGGLLEPTERP
jgi:hypothetical protein